MKPNKLCVTVAVIKHSLKHTLLALLLLQCASTAFSQNQSSGTGKQLLTGLVIDSLGKPLSGATISSLGKITASTSTDQNGRFILSVATGDSIRISFIGYQEQTIRPGNKAGNITVQLMPAISGGEEVIVTAFGRRQRKEAVVGSVTTIEPGNLKIPSSNLTNALAGQVAGVIAYQRSGQPGVDNASFFVRGVTTFGYSASPLILIDNIELSASDLARVQVDDIASFSILKDASAAALYGARGANGVILVTTKSGQAGRAKVNLRVEQAISKPTRNVELADPITYMKLFNESITTRNPLSAPMFTPNQILNTQNTVNKTEGYNPYVYPAVDWMSVLFKKQTTTQRADFSVSGGNDLARYYIAGSYSRDNGILQVNPVNNFNSGMKFENYQLRSNVNVKLTKTTEAVVRLWGNFNDYTGPITSASNGLATDLYSKALHTSPVMFPAFYEPDSANRLTKHILFGNTFNTGNLLTSNPYADLMYGYKNFAESRISAQFELNQNFGFLLKGLSFRGLFSTNRYSYFDLTRSYKPFYYNIASYEPKTDVYTLQWLNSAQGAAQEYLSYYPGAKTITTYLYMLGALDYNVNIGKHRINASLQSTREQRLNANELTLQNSLPYRNIGVAGRTTYSYDNRYFAEFNFGYNASERFSTQHRWGYFPTVGAGWVISNERFWNGRISEFITRLKLRGSYGLVGNDQIGSQRFFYMSNVTIGGGAGATFGTTNANTLNGAAITNYPNPGVTWETARKANLALEMTLLKNLNIVAEIYHEYRYNILMNRASIPTTSGLEAPVSANLGTAYAKGLDLSMDYKHNISKSLWLSARANLTISSSRYGRYEEPEYGDSWRYLAGQPINLRWGYIAERLFVDDKEAANSPRQLFGGALPSGGDIKYRDVNKDGLIDEHDQVPMGLPTSPQIIYGFGFSSGYKNFDLSAFFQGLARESFYIDPYSTAPFVDNAQLLKAYANDHWSEENQNLYALWPRLSSFHNSNNEQISSWWLRNGSFLRLKSLEIGYTFPKKLLDRIYFTNMRIYFSGLNLATFSSFKLWDPELGGNAFNYPVQKVYNVGINLNF